MAVNDVYTQGPAAETTVTMVAERWRRTNMPDNLKIKMLDRDRMGLTRDAPGDYPDNVSGHRVDWKDTTPTPAR